MMSTVVAALALTSVAIVLALWLRIRARDTPKITTEYVTAVWGDNFVQLFLDICLPSQLARKNRRALSKGKAVYVIYTKSEYVQKIQEDVSIRRLIETGIPVDIRDINFEMTDLAKVAKYGYISQCHRHALKIAHERGHAFS